MPRRCAPRNDVEDVTLPGAIMMRNDNKQCKCGLPAGASRLRNDVLIFGGVYLYLSIGNDMAVRESSIIGIFDLDNTSYSKRTVEFLNKAEKDGLIIPCDDLPKSFVVTAEYGLSRVHLTSLNSYTLEKRLK